MAEEKKSKPSGYSILRKKLEKAEQELDKVRQENVSLSSTLNQWKAKYEAIKDNDWKKSYDSLNKYYEDYRKTIQAKIANLGFIGRILWNRA